MGIVRAIRPKRLKDLEGQNAKLKKQVVNVSLEQAIPKNVPEGNL